MTAESARPIRVLLVDDHAVVRKGLCALIEREPGIDVVGEAESGERAVQAADRLRPDVVLMDLATLPLECHRRPERSEGVGLPT
jgi:DNA-binding NarL/FixJ family response regulator